MNYLIVSIISFIFVFLIMNIKSTIYYSIYRKYATNDQELLEIGSKYSFSDPKTLILNQKGRLSTMRIYSIINYMLENDRYVTLTELSEYVNMSVPTIRLDLVKVEEIIDKVDANLIRKRGVGIKIEYNESSKSKLIQMIDSKMIHKNEEITTLDTEILKI